MCLKASGSSSTGSLIPQTHKNLGLTTDGHAINSGCMSGYFKDELKRKNWSIFILHLPITSSIVLRHSTPPPLL